MSNHTPAPEDHATRLAGLMNSAGYEPTDALHDALVQEFTNCAEADAEDGSMDSLGDFLDALQYAAGRFAYTEN